MRIRPASPSDLRAVIEIQNSSPQAAPWLETDYARLAVDPNGMMLVAEHIFSPQLNYLGEVGEGTKALQRSEFELSPRQLDICGVGRDLGADP